MKYRDFEVVECKGKGHPDTICDSLMDSVSVAYCKAMMDKYGVIPHHNFDKCLLTAGSTTPKFNGGSIDKPIELYMGDRATILEDFDLDALMCSTATSWFKENIRNMPPYGFKVINRTSKGSTNLRDIWKRGAIGANDTSATVGYYPASPVEQIVKDLEKHINSDSFKNDYPMVGEDVKIMAVRQENNLNLTVAIAMIDKYIPTDIYYVGCKDKLTYKISSFLDKALEDTKMKKYQVVVNALDNYNRGVDGLYLTVTGTSAESGDSGQVGRGNDPSGVIPLCRPMASEAAPGKNPVSHVGKIYNALSFKIAKSVHTELDLRSNEVYCWMVSKIGSPLNEPMAVSVQHTASMCLNEEIKRIVEYEIDQLPKLQEDLSLGRYKLW
jgi:S-adenosylmethionine synthetase